MQVTQDHVSWSRDRLCYAIAPDGPPLTELLKIASDLRDHVHGRVVSFSRNIFLPLTTLCRDYCSYCTFRKDPDEPGTRIMSPDEVRADIRSGERLGCTEALFSLGDKPEAVFVEMRRRLAAYGHRTTIEYLNATCRQVLEESSFIPHSNPDLMTFAALRLLARANGSLGLMLENVSHRFAHPGMPHHRAPDNAPRRRLQTIADAGRLRIPFTTGILFGMGETASKCVDSLLAIRRIHERYGHIQEVIVQNFRPKAGTPLAHQAEPAFEQVLRTGPSDRRRGPPHVGRGHEHPGTTKPFREGISQFAGRRNQRLGWRLTGDTRLHQPRSALATSS